MTDSSFLGWPISAWKDMAEIVALIVGGSWAYLLFVRGRARFPRASLTHRLDHRPLSDGRWLLRLGVEISNPGVVVLSIRKATFRVQQVFPLPDGVQEVIQKGQDPVPPTELDMSWPPLAERVHEWPKKQFEIEPGETDEVTCDFFLEENLKTVQVYCYFKNAKKRRREIGWPLTTLYDLGPDSSGSVERTVANLAGKERGS